MSTNRRSPKRRTKDGRSHASGRRSGAPGPHPPASPTAEELARSERLARVRLGLLWAVPVLSLGAAAGLYFALENSIGAGVALLVGSITWLGLGLTALGARVPPSDRERA